MHAARARTAFVPLFVCVPVAFLRCTLQERATVGDRLFKAFCVARGNKVLASAQLCSAL